jgi:hypothetical protein
MDWSPVSREDGSPGSRQDSEPLCCIERMSSFCWRKYGAEPMAHLALQNEQHHQVIPMERRTQDRYLLSARAVFSWEGPEQKRFEGDGVTRDISIAGAFILTRSCPPTHSTVQVELFLPPFHGTVATVRMRAEARVLRVEYGPPGEQQSGFAVDSPGFRLPSEVEPDSECGSSLTSD